MLLILAEIEAKPASQDEVKQILEKMVASTEKETGNIFYALHHLRDFPHRFIVYELYRDQAACDEHFQSAYLQSALESMKGLLENEPKLTFGATVATTRLPQK